MSTLFINLLVLASVPSFLLTGLLALFWTKKKSWSQKNYKQAFKASILGWFCFSILWCGWIWFLSGSGLHNIWDVLKYAVVA